MSAIRCGAIVGLQGDRQLEHPACAQATFAALQNTYDFLTPDLWRETRYEKQPIQEFTDFLARPAIAEAPKAYPY